MFEALYWIFIAAVSLGVLLAPLWLAGLIGLYLKWPLAHLLPITAVAWVCLSVYSGLNTWLARGS